MKDLNVESDYLNLSRCSRIWTKTEFKYISVSLISLSKSTSFKGEKSLTYHQFVTDSFSSTINLNKESNKSSIKPS